MSGEIEGNYETSESGEAIFRTVYESGVLPAVQLCSIILVTHSMYSQGVFEPMFENLHIQRPAEKRKVRPLTLLYATFITNMQLRKVSDHIFMVLLWTDIMHVDTQI
jgi:hypothetical protein